MSGLAAFFRYCPQRGKRFDVRLEGKKLISEKDIVVGRFTNTGMYGPLRGPSELGKPREEIDEEDFLYTYKCKSCGHEWSEVHKKYPSFGKPGSGPSATE